MDTDAGSPEMPADIAYTCVTAGIIVALVAWNVARKGFDPFSPHWLFLAGYFQIYVIQALSYREYALRARGVELVTEANLRALWALGWFLLVYYSGLGRRIAAKLPAAPTAWSPALVTVAAPPLILWGLVCAGVALRAENATPEVNLLHQFPIMMLLAGVLMLVTGRQPDHPRPMLTCAGLLVISLYVMVWMFNGRRSHAIIGVLTGVCAWYVPRWRRPSLPVLGVTAIACALVVSLALGWRGNMRYERSPAGFLHFLSEFNPASVLINLNLKDHEDPTGSIPEQTSKETEEYGGYLLMLYAVPDLSGYDYGSNYLRVFSTYIPRVVWPDKPIYGRDAWVSAWIAGSEFPRNSEFTGPAIGILGATQLNGGVPATILVLGIVALMLRTAYDYFRFHCHTPWAQAWWALTYYNAWLMTVNDDPMVWFYYIYGHTTLPPMFALWLLLQLAGPGLVYQRHTQLAHM